MRKGIFCGLLAGLLLHSSLSHAQLPPKLPRGLVRDLLRIPAGQPIPPATRQVLAGLSQAQIAQLTRQIERANKKLAQQNRRTQLFQQQLFDATRPAVFRALPAGSGPRDSFTGTLFEISTENGEKEIFGVIAMHTLKNEYSTKGLLSYKFTAVVEKDEEIHLLPAWVVQLSTDKMADVALVKFRKEDEKFLSPLVLAEDQPLNEPLYTQGFACNLLTHSLAHPSGVTSTGMLTTRLPAARVGARAGFCGSPLVDKNFRLTGIHVGSSYQESSASQEGQAAQPAPPADFKTDVVTSSWGDEGFAVPAAFLRNIVEAYHHPKKEVVPVLLNGREVSRLSVNEYISRVEILDDKQQILWHQNTQHKVTLRPVEQALSVFPQAHWVRLYVGKSHWQKNERGWFVINEDIPSRVVLLLVPKKS